MELLHFHVVQLALDQIREGVSAETKVDEKVLCGDVLEVGGEAARQRGHGRAEMKDEEEGEEEEACERRELRWRWAHLSGSRSPVLPRRENPGGCVLVLPGFAVHWCAKEELPTPRHAV